MKPRKFNPLLAYGIVTPPYNGAVHMQDGGYFAPDGTLLWEDHPATPPKKVKSTVIEVDSETNTMTETEVEDEVDESAPGDARDILSKWLKGEIDINFQTVRGKVKEAYQVILASKAEVIDYLVNTALLVPAELVKVGAK